MGIVQSKIELDNPAKTYFNGDEITGKIYLGIDEPKQVKGIKLTVSGEGRIHWSRTRFKDIHSAEFVKEVYVNNDNFLVDGPTVIPPGWHVYPFSYKLPIAIPYTYEDEYGQIKYKVKATIQRAWYLCDHEREVDFQVIVPLDLNYDSKAAEPARETISKTFMGCSGSADMTVSLPVSGYIPGQTVPVTVDLKNGSRVTIKGIYFSLIKSVKYHGESKTRTEEELLADQETPVQSDSDAPIRIQHFLQIPATQASYLKHSKLIDIDYLVRVEVRVGGLHKNFELDVPIIIGTTALLASTVAMAQGVPAQRNTKSDLAPQL